MEILRKGSTGVGLLMALAILLTALWSTSGSFDSSDVVIRARVSHQILLHGMPTVEYTGDAATPALYQDEYGTFTAQYGIGQSLFFLPFTALAGLVTQHLAVPPETRLRIHLLLMSVPVFTVVLLLNTWLSKQVAANLGLTRFQSWLVALVATFGSGFWQMAKQGQEEVQLSILLLAAVWAFLLWYRQGRLWPVWVSAICAGSAIVFRVTASPLYCGVFSLYLITAWQQREKQPLQTFKQVALPFTTLALLSVLCLAGYNFYKTGNPFETGYALSGWFIRSWVDGIIGPTIGLDRGILITQPWLAPGLLITALAWQHLPSLLKTLLSVCAFLFAVSIATYARCCWAGDHTYGTRFQIHLIPLICVALGAAATTYWKIYWPIFWKPHQGKVAAFALFLLVSAQIPSIAFVHNLELYQAANSALPARNGSLTGNVGQVKLRYQNFVSKIMTGHPLDLGSAEDSPITDAELAQASRWNIWLWRGKPYIPAHMWGLAQQVWVACFSTSWLCWLLALRGLWSDEAREMRRLAQKETQQGFF